VFISIFLYAGGWINVDGYPHVDEEQVFPNVIYGNYKQFLKSFAVVIESMNDVLRLRRGR